MHVGGGKVGHRGFRKWGRERCSQHSGKPGAGGTVIGILHRAELASQGVPAVTCMVVGGPPGKRVNESGSRRQLVETVS